jgi:hypothetical protein
MNVTKGQIIPIDGPGPSIRFQWNPAKIEGPVVNAEYVMIPVAGRDAPYIQYSHGKEKRIRFTIEVSRYNNDDGYVNSVYNSLRALTQPSMKLAGVSRPPRVMLIIGSFLRAVCVLIEVTPSFEGIFSPNSLLPHNAKYTLTFLEYTG